MINKIKFIYRNILPNYFRIKFRIIFKYFFYKFRYLKLKFLLNRNKKVKIILGAALTNQKGWLSTNEEWLDISDYKDWFRLFKGKALVKRALAEHVFEHLSREQMKTAFKLIYTHLCKEGTLRIAVPDGNHPNETYRKNTGINGIGADASDHKQFLSYEIIENDLRDVGFKCLHMQGFNNKGDLIVKKLPAELGFIMRSRTNPNRSSSEIWDFVDSQTSLIVDAYK